MARALYRHAIQGHNPLTLTPMRCPAATATTRERGRGARGGEATASNAGPPQTLDSLKLSTASNSGLPSP
eukprot:scaffold2922_cov125-Isochrysis_galbana.AAC.3